MAHLVRLGALTDELISILTSTTAKVNNSSFVSPISSLIDSKHGLTLSRLIQESSSLIEKQPCGLYAAIVILAQINLMFRHSWKVWRKSSESTMKIP